MGLFKQKPVAAGDSDLTDNIGTMQDDLAKIISNKNHGRILTEGARSLSGKKPASGRSKEIQRDLADVYTDNDGQIPDLTRLDKSERPLWQTILYVLVAVFSALLLVSIAGFIIFSNLSGDTFTNERVLFKLEPPISVVSGLEQDYTIIISNSEKVNLYNLNITLLYPDGFQHVSSSLDASGDKNNIWDISVLKVGESKEIKLRAKLSGAINTVQNLSGILTFKPENLNAEFNQKTSIDLGVNSSVLSLAIEAEEKTLANKDVEYEVKIRNIGEEILKDIEVTAEYPQGFVASAAEPSAKAGSDNIWTIDKLATTTAETAAAGEKKIIIRGKYSGVSIAGNQELKVKATVKAGGSPLLMAEQSHVISVVKDQLELTMIVNGSGEDQAVSFGDMLYYTLSFKNTGQEELKNIELKAILASEVLDWDTLSDTSGKKRADAIVWTGKEEPKLLSLRPGEEGDISWQIRVKDLSELDQSDVAKFSIESRAEAKITVADGSSIIVSGKTLTNAISSDLGLQASARYYDEDNIALGAGPIQPQAGSASSYNIRLVLSNNLHSISNVIVTAILPKNVNWDNKEWHNTGDIAYSDKSRKVTWMISKLSKTARGAEANFNLSISPVEGDIGRVLILLPEVTLSARDLDTGADISKSVKAITTAFNDPILGQVSGIVE